MLAYFVDDKGNDLATAEFSTLPHIGEQIDIRLFAGFATTDGKEPHVPDSIVLRVERVIFNAFNSKAITENLQTWTFGKDAYAVVTVSAVDEDAQTYIQYVVNSLVE